MKKLRIAIQGIRGSNHHMVATEYFGEDIDLVESLSFHSLVDALLDGQADKGVMAIENSIAGSIIPNYALVCEKQLHIIGEHYLNIHHHLMALPGQKLGDIREVHSPISGWWKMWIQLKLPGVSGKIPWKG
jgi:prephenate dehydratase